jgi:hypothetical protein
VAAIIYGAIRLLHLANMQLTLKNPRLCLSVNPVCTYIPTKKVRESITKTKLCILFRLLHLANMSAPPELSFKEGCIFANQVIKMCSILTTP